MKNKVMYLVSLAYMLASVNTYNSAIPVDVYLGYDPSLTAHLRLMSVHQVGILFFTVSALCVLLTWAKRVEIAYAAMTGLLSFWTILYLMSWIQTGYWQSIYGASNYILVGIILHLVNRAVVLPKEMEKAEDKLEMFGDSNKLRPSLDQNEEESR